MIRLRFLFNIARTQRYISTRPVVLARQIARPTTSSNELQVNRFDAPSIGPLDTQQISNLIKGSSEPVELLSFIKNIKKDDIDPQNLSLAMDQLLTLQKSKRSDSSSVVRQEGFVKMCHLLKFKAPRMEANELLICLKVLTFFGLSTESAVVHRLLDLVRDRINDFSPINLMFLNFVLSKASPTPLSQAICTAIPAVLDLNIVLKLDRENPAEIADMIRYMSASKLGISIESKLSIANAATSLGHSFTPPQAKNIISSLSVMQDFDPAFEEVVLNCYSIMSQKLDELTFHDIETTVDFMLEAYFRGFDIFYNENFFNNCAEFLVRKDLGYLEGSYILRKFNKINFVNLQLLEYLDDKIAGSDKKAYDGKIAGPITLATGFAIANFKSKHQEEFKSLMNENLKSHLHRLEIPWLRLAQDLMSLGFHSQVLLDRVFSTEHLEKALLRKPKYPNHMQLLLLWQTVKLLIPNYNGSLPDQKFIDDALLMNRPLTNKNFENILCNSFGHVLTNIETSHGHLLDYVIAFDAKENPVAVTATKFEEIPKDLRPVAVFLHGPSDCPVNLPRRLRSTVELKLKTVHALGIKTVSVFSHSIQSLPEPERTAFLEREVRYGLA